MIDNRKNPNSEDRKIGFEWYVLRGGLIDSTRDFCRERNDKYFHYKEIMDLANEDWEGKHPRTTEKTIFKYAGGYCNAGDIDQTCHHTFMPTSIALVPKYVLYRNIEKGYLKLNEAQMRVLDLIP